MPANAAIQFWNRCGSLTLDIVFQETPQSKVKGEEIDIREQAGHAVEKLLLFENAVLKIALHQDHCTKFAVLHENCILKTYSLFNLWDYKIPWDITVLFSCDATRLDSISCYCSEK